jgi:hypothetical protein
MTRYPVVINGKKDDWYFVSRLTKNDPYENLRMGDRVLGIW